MQVILARGALRDAASCARITSEYVSLFMMLYIFADQQKTTTGAKAQGVRQGEVKEEPAGREKRAAACALGILRADHFGKALRSAA